MTSTATARGKARKSEVARYQMYIDGKFVDAKSGKTFDVYDPVHRRRDRHLPGRRRRGRRPAPRRRRTAAFYDGWRSASARRSAAGSCSGWPSGSAPDGPSWRELETLNSGKPIVESEYDMDDAATCFEYYGGLATKINGEVLPVPGRRRRLCHAGADGGGGPDHPVELSAADGRLEDRARARGRLHRGAQAGRADAAHHPRSWPRTSRRWVCRPAWSTSSPATARARARRSSPIPTCGRSPSPAAPRSARSSCGTPPTSSSGSRSSWAASRPTSSSATPTSRTRWTAPSSAPSSTRARSARPGAACWCSRTSTRSSWTPPRPRRRPSSSAPGMDRETKMGPLVSAEQRDRVASYLKVGRGEAKVAVGRRDAQAVREGLVRRAHHLLRRGQLGQDRPGGDLRPGDERHPVQGRGRGDPDRQRDAVRPRGRGVDPGHLQGVPGGEGARGRDRVGQPHAADLRRGAVGRLQGVAASAASSATGESRSTWRRSRCSSTWTRSRSAGTEARLSSRATPCHPERSEGSCPPWQDPSLRSG